MPRKVRVHTDGDNSQPTRLTPKSLTKQEFGRRVYHLMLKRGWTQSELARQAGLPRDAISVYVRGKSLPTPNNLQRLAETFGTAKEELLPNYLESAIEEDNPSFEMKVSGGDPGRAWVRVNRLVSVSTAVRIADLLEQDDVADRKRSGRSTAV